MPPPPFVDLLTPTAAATPVGPAAALPLVLGVLLVLLGAAGATVTQRHLDAAGQPRRAVAALVPFGVLVGAGASLVRGWDLMASVVVGAVLLPLVGAVGRMVEVRRARRTPRR